MEDAAAAAAASLCHHHRHHRRLIAVRAVPYSMRSLLAIRIREQTESVLLAATFSARMGSTAADVDRVCGDLA